MQQTESIEVHGSPLPDQLWAAVRQIAPAVVAFALGREWISGDEATLLAVVGGVAWPIIAGQLKTRRRAKELIAVASSPRVPADLAYIKTKKGETT